MQTKIENYRGYDLFFDTEKEKFTFSLDSSGYKEKTSFSACKKNIDDLIKEKPKLVPFTFEDRELLKGKWLISKVNSGMYAILFINEHGVSVNNYDITYQELFDTFIFEDGSPCGKIEN